jgi:HK97 gp10 family phage protein
MQTLTLQGGPELAAVLNRLSKAAKRQQLYPILKAAAAPMRDHAAGSARRRPPTPDLADHIAVAAATRVGSIEGGKWSPTDENQAAVAMGPTKGFEHGIFLEYGTVHSRAFPFMRPAFDGGVAKAFGIIQDGIWALLRKNAGKTRTIASPTGTGTL